MRGPRSILAMTALWVLGCASFAFSQEGGARELRRNRSLDRMRAIRQNADFSGAADYSRTRLGTFQQSRFTGMRTRSEQLDMILRSFRPERTERDLTQLDNPIRDILDKRNLLSPRSALAVKSVSSLGRNLIVSPTSPEAPAESPSLTAPTAENKKIDRILGNRHEHRSDEYFEKGLKFFRQGDFIRAASYFDIDADLNYKDARPHVAGAMAAYQNMDINQAYFRLMTAIGRARTLDDMRLDVNAFYPNRRDFERTLNAVNIWAKSLGDRPAPNMILAYYSWLNGDRSTSLAAVEVSIQHPGSPDEESVCKKFRDLLMAAPTTTQP